MLSINLALPIFTAKTKRLFLFIGDHKKLLVIGRLISYFVLEGSYSNNNINIMKL